MSPLSAECIAALFRRWPFILGAVAGLCIVLAQISPALAEESRNLLQRAQDDVGKPNLNRQILRQDRLRIYRVPEQTKVRVPDLRGKTFPAAKDEAERLGLRLGANEFQNTAAPRYRVSRQSPRPGTMALPKSWIAVDTEPWVQVPRLTDRSPDRADRIATKAGLKTEVAKTVEAKVAAPVIRDQRPKPGIWVPEGSLVGLVVAKPPALVRVPRVTGFELNAAQGRIRAGDLVPSIGSTTRGDVNEPTVARQEPDGGDLVKPGSRVRLDIVRPRAAPPPEPEPKEPDLVRVPNLLGHSVREAETLLPPSLRLREGRRINGEVGTEERIVKQDPAPDRRVKPGTTVTVDIALPPPLVPVPAIIGLTLSEAIAKVTKSPFSFRAEGPDEIDNAGSTVVDQRPAADTMAPLGSTIVAEMEPLPITVPPIVGETLARGRALVEDAKLRFQPRGLRQIDPAKQRIVAQVPEAGSEVRPGTAVFARIAPPLPPRKPLVAVPDLHALSRLAAQDQLAPIGLGLSIAETTVPTGDRIERQSPAPGILVVRGSVVRVWLEMALVRVPDLAGLTRDDAARRLAEDDLRLAPPQSDEPRDPTGVVEGQRPLPGADVPPQTEVAVTLSVPQPPGPGTEDRPRPEPVPEPLPSPEPEVLIALTPRDVWWAAGGAFLMLLLLAGWRLTRPRTTRSAASRKPPAVSFEVDRDLGEQEIAWDEEPGVRCRLHLRTIPDRGTQSLVEEPDVEPQAERRYG